MSLVYRYDLTTPGGLWSPDNVFSNVFLKNPMKRPRQRLTDKVVRKLDLAPSGQYQVRDTELRGFMIVVGTGSKTWTVQVDRSAGGRQTKKKKIGDAAIMKVVDARRLAMAKIAELRGPQGAGEATGAPVTLAGAWGPLRRTSATGSPQGARAPRPWTCTAA